jgi:hypothetical protein
MPFMIEVIVYLTVITDKLLEYCRCFKTCIALSRRQTKENLAANRHSADKLLRTSHKEF